MYAQTSNRFTRLPNGVHYRFVSRFDVEAERQKEWEQSAEGKAARAQQKLKDAREADFTMAEKAKAYALATKEFKGTAHDVIQIQEVWHKDGDVRVAALDLLVMYHVSAERDMGVDGEVEDCVHIIVYRDGSNPKKLYSTSYC